jgi:hypothetical protein
MAAKQRFDQLKHQLDRLRKDSHDLVAQANRIVLGGVHRVADKELKALNDYYKEAVTSIKSARRDDLKGLAHKQLDLLQSTVNQVIAHARESVGIIASTREELARLIQKSQGGGKVSAAELKQAAAPARKAAAKVKSAARKAGAQTGKNKPAAKRKPATGRKTLKQTATAVDPAAGSTSGAIKPQS